MPQCSNANNLTLNCDRDNDSAGDSARGEGRHWLQPVFEPRLSMAGPNSFGGRRKRRPPRTASGAALNAAPGFQNNVSRNRRYFFFFFAAFFAFFGAAFLAGFFAASLAVLRVIFFIA